MASFTLDIEGQILLETIKGTSDSDRKDGKVVGPHKRFPCKCMRFQLSIFKDIICWSRPQAKVLGQPYVFKAPLPP